MIDLHSHVLPRLDDGARGLAESVEIAGMAARAGVRTIVATPHVRGDYPFDLDKIDVRTAEVNGALADAGIAVEVLPGAEIALEALARLTDADLRRLSLGRSGRYILLEMPRGLLRPRVIEGVVRALASRDFRAVLAHPERNARLFEPRHLDLLIRLGAVVQLTAGSLLGEFGDRAREHALELLRHGRAHVLGSDAHRADARVLAVAAVAEEVLPSFLSEAARRALLHERPQAILNGADIDLPSAPRDQPLRNRFPFPVR